MADEYWGGTFKDGAYPCCSMGKSLSSLRAEWDATPEGQPKEIARIKHDGALLRSKTSEQVLAELRALPQSAPPTPEHYELARQYCLLKEFEAIVADSTGVR